MHLQKTGPGPLVAGDSARKVWARDFARDQTADSWAVTTGQTWQSRHSCSCCLHGHAKHCPLSPDWWLGTCETGAAREWGLFRKKWKFLSNLRHFHCFLFGPKVFTLLLLSADISNWFENLPNNNWGKYYFFKIKTRMLLLEPVPIFSIITQWPLVMTPRLLRARERKVLSSPSCAWPRDLTSISLVLFPLPIIILSDGSKQLATLVSLSSKYHHSIWLPPNK